MDIKLRFLGAAGNVTGSRYLLSANGLNILVDCGMYQEHDLKDRNWEKFTPSPAEIDAVFLTHAHLDHCGLLPRLLKEGYEGKIYCTSATADIAKIILLDCAKINEEDAEFKRLRHEREGRQGRFPIIPLYTQEEARTVFPYFENVEFGEPVAVGPGVTAEFQEVGHILGASMVRFTITSGEETRTIVFSGDVGRSNMPILRDPSPIGTADYVVIESTYGNRTHGTAEDIPKRLADVVNATTEAGGNLIIPSFAVERTQDLLYYLSLLLSQDRIPHLQIFVDSPMATKVSEVFTRHPKLFDKETIALGRIFRINNVTLVRTTEQSKAINHIRGTCIIISGSGMCTGGRIKHHLAHNISSPENTILFVGYQAQNTLGREILDGNEVVRILGEKYQVRANITSISGFSAHADANELQAFLATCTSKPRQVFVTHGEPQAAQALADKLATEGNYSTHIAKYQETVILD